MTDKRMLLDVIMPNGKKLRDCTGYECREMGNWLMALGGSEPDTQERLDLMEKIIREAREK
jgi:hypothetical protein